MDKNKFAFDITDVSVDIMLDKKERHESILKSMGNINYDKKIKVNDTIIYLNFLSNEELSSKSILKAIYSQNSK